MDKDMTIFSNAIVATIMSVVIVITHMIYSLNATSIGIDHYIVMLSMIGFTGALWYRYIRNISINK